MDVLSSLSSNIFFCFRVVDYLGLDWEILNSFPGSFNRFIFYDGLLDFFGDVLNLGFHCIVVGDGSLHWNSLVVDHFLILDNFSLVRDSFNSFHLVIFNVFFLEGDVFNSAFNWDFFRYCSVSLRSSGNVVAFRVGSSADIVGSNWLCGGDICVVGGVWLCTTDISGGLGGSVLRGGSISNRGGVVIVGFV